MDGAQERLLVDLVEGARTLPESQQTDFGGIEPPETNGSVLLRHSGLPAGYETHALHLVVLEQHGCIRMTATGPGTHSIGLLLAAAECHEEIRANVMAALTGYLLKSVLKAPPEALGIWLRALPHAAGDRMLVEHIEGEHFPDGTFGAWIKGAFRALTGPTRDTPTS